jgi:hypothetical protein
MMTNTEREGLVLRRAPIDEQLIPIQDVPAIVAELRPGRPLLHWSTPLRWCKKGCRGLKLFSTFQGWQRLTNRRAVREFLEQLDARDAQAAVNPPETERQVSKRQKQIAAELAALGW